MATLTIELPSHSSQTEFNLRRWDEVLRDPTLAMIEGRIETDRFGHIVMSPPPAADHSDFQGEIYHQLRMLMPDGRVNPECPISTADGVKAADVTWASPARLVERGNRVVYPKCPEICVEIISPSNTRSEIEEKARLYFDAGAQEVWTCRNGAMTFLGADLEPMDRSKLCPQFPARIKIT